MKITSALFFLVYICFACGEEASRISRQAGVCGSSVRSTGYVVHGTSVERGDYPWIVALMYTGTSPPSYFCGGTLVSSKHVITAAHCIKDKNQYQQLYSADVLALFGAYNLTNAFEPERTSLSPEEIRIHEEWNPHVERFDADIAILKFAPNMITFTRFIQPVCLWSSPSAATETDGIVAGWGQNEDESQLYQPIPKLVKVPMYTNEICFLDTPGLAKISSTRTFCAGVKDGSGVCLGDSGNGYFIKSGNLLYLRGIVSSSRTTATSCDVTSYAVYTDVLKFKKWISEMIGDSSPVVVQSTPTPTPDAVHFPSESVLECGVPDYKLSSRFKRIVSPIGAVAKGQFPWLAALYSSDISNQSQFFCGATLVSRKVVVTAAHCLFDYFSKVLRTAETLSVHLGKSNLESLNEQGFVLSAVSGISIHPDWKPDTESRDADIAALILSRTIDPSMFIKPICIWSSTKSFDDLVGSKGAVAGWGYISAASRNTSFEQPQWTEVKVVTEETCLRSNRDFFEVTSDRTFCAKDEAGLSGPCNGDSGGGFFVQNSGKWYFRGIISGGLVTDGRCDIKNFAVYTDVSQFSGWLNKIIVQSLQKPECGVPDKSSSRFKRIISPMGAVARGQFPWLAALYFNDGSVQPTFFCGATLVSQKVVVTSADCIAEKGEKPNEVENLSVYLGISNLESPNEQGIVMSAVSGISVHPDWNPRTQSYDADIAALFLSRAIVPNSFIKPICIWSSTKSFNDLVGSKGVVAGWGFITAALRKPSLEQPQWTEVKVVAQVTCLRSNRGFIEMTSNRTFCAKDEAGLSGPCRGDGGGGLFVQVNGKWHFRGIVSTSLNEGGSCDIKNFSVYTDVAQFSDWIKELVSRHG